MRALIPLLLLTACYYKAASGDVIYMRDIKPITDTHCAICHTDGGIAPFPLTSYDEVSAMADAVNDAVQDGRMPPWKADNDCNSYLYDYSLTEDQKALFQVWVEGGAPKGDYADKVEAEPLDLGEMSRVDVSYPMDSKYIPQIEPDDFRCFVYEWDEGAAYITGMQVDPGEPRVVHHVVAYSLSPDGLAEASALDDADIGIGYNCFGGPNLSGSPDWLGAWVPGSSGHDFPDGTGILMEEGGGVVVQIHYNTDTAGALPDNTTVSFKVDSSVDVPARVSKILDPAWLTGTTVLDIGAGEPDASAAFTLQVPTDILIYTAGLHMHQLGSSAKLYTTSSAGEQTCLLDIPEWDFHWQGSYTLAERVLIGRGDTVTVECHWDNSDGEAAVGWGEGTAEEMCLGTAYITQP